MIKKISFIFLFLCFISFNSWAENISASSRITEVTVYPGSARLKREAVIDLSTGSRSIVLEDILGKVDENSVSVTGRGEAQVKIYGAYLKKEYLKEASDERVKGLENNIEALEDKISVENNNLKILEEEEGFLNSIKLFSGEQIPKDLVTTMPSGTKLKEILDFLILNSKDLQEKKEGIRLKAREWSKEKEKLVSELKNLRGASQKLKHSIVVDLDAVKPGKFSLAVSYLVTGANWRPLYDARVKFEQEEVELTSFGVITQTTGEDWANVKLTLSTAKPTLGGRMPYVEPWFLRPVEVRREKQRMRAAMEMMAESPLHQQDALYLEKAEESKEEEAQLAFTEVAYEGLSIVYQILKPASIKSDGSETKFPVTTQTLKANLEYSAYPRSSPYVYLGSRVKNAPNLQLLAGQVNVFLDENFVGKSSIDTIGPGEEFDLYLGVDEGVKVKREQLSKKADDVLIGNISSPSLKTTFAYRITVENYKPKKMKVIIFESLPISENDRIKVKIFDEKPGPQEKDWKARKGVWRWEFELESQAKQEIFYSYLIEHPREMSISGF